MASITSRHRNTFAGLALLAVLGALAAAYIGPTARAARAQAAAGHAAPAAAMDRRPHQDAEALPATPAAHAAPVAAARPREPVTETERLLQVERNIQALDARFAAEPADGAWAHGQAREIARFFEPKALAAAGLGTPGDLRVDCRSHSCRVSGVFTDELEAEETSQRLAMHLASSLPYGAVMPRRSPNGGIEVSAWYSSTPIKL